MTWLDEGPEPLPEDLLSKLAPATSYLYEWREYWLKAPHADSVAVGTTQAEKIGEDLFRIRFENQLGLSAIQPFAAGRPLGQPLWIEVISSKFPTPDRHYKFYRVLLEDLFARATLLPFRFTGSTSRGVSESLHPPSPLFVYYFFLQFAPLLRQALETIHARPHRLLVDHPAYVPLVQASEADADVLVDILHSPDRWVRANGFPLAQRMHGYAPTEVWQRLPEETLNTPENRFVLAFLRQLLVAAESLRRQSWWNNVPSNRKEAISTTTYALREFMGWQIFDDVGEMKRAPYASQVLLRREGYREIRVLYERFNQARIPLFAPLQHAIEVRDIATLYEQWCFFALVEEIGTSLGITPDVEYKTAVEPGLKQQTKARFGDEGELHYNRWGRGYSMRLRPDFSWIRNGKLEVVLDAKFRLEWTDQALDDEGDTPDAKAKREDLYKMHTYRDALGVRAAVAVYPGTKFSYFSNIESGVVPEKLITVLTQPAVGGIGAFPYRP